MQGLTVPTVDQPQASRDQLELSVVIPCLNVS